MIRFACPGCSANLTADDSEGGKADSCPTCQTRYVIPPAGDASPPPLPAPAGPVEVAPCPKCGTRLSVTPADLGSDVECPYCRAVFAAQKPGAVAPLKPPRKGGGLDFGEADTGSGSRRRRPADDEDDRPRSRRRQDEERDEEDDRPRRRRSRRDEDEYDDGPPKSRVAYIILALFLGGLGVHNFYAGRNTEGAVQLVLWVVAWPLLCACYFGLAVFLALFVWNIVEIITVDRDADGRRMI